MCGSRTWTDTADLTMQMAVLFGEDRDRVVIHGGNGDPRARPPRGADVLAGWVAKGLGSGVVVFAVDHTIDGPWPGAGPRRNERMFRDGQPDRGLALGSLWRPNPHGGRRSYAGTTTPLWKHTGTGGMVAIMLTASVPVRWVAAPGVAAVDLVEMPPPPRDGR